MAEETQSATTTTEQSAAQAPTPAATDAGQAQQAATLLGDQQQAADKTGEDQAKPPEDQAKPPEDQAKPPEDPAKPQGAPEKYEFKPPEGSQLEGKPLAQFEEVARELNMTNEAAQKVIDKVAPALAERQAELVKEANTAWLQAAQTDKEFGGDKLTENIGVAKQALEAYGSPALKELLDKTGLGNHPEIIRAFYRAGKNIQPDNKVVTGGEPPSKGQKDHAAKLYPNQV
jgi:hypothetical protein